ncbi:sn-glycerol-3-phosphate ABC transporter ATP-binding protein UgpC [Pararhizobium sp. YC-54]|uniref:sn-glycerol-3-phosphate ABC transporter ATP-binding protein UgpC n=1 Tax=Pararhizobium sp. YC-54 TaxID=2986920 RepID=UPI0021F7E9D8|nr:sn-glycerol-3-phosphate ABC transporter ATP-binding protein UgpC [Pararhizobium sp. YC-54]MCV9999652.1 sn-glycerol-3-phosphate ABC transporter ATP-binding protein UgpC [Pararhizobium sp. YC-54]
MAHLNLSGLKKSYDGKQVVHGIDMEILEGEFIVIVGPSGCGKSTLLRMIAGLEDISGGELLIDGQCMNDVEPSQRGCAMVFQNYALYPHMTVRQNIGYPLKVARIPKADIQRRVEAVAATLALTDYLDRRPAQLSGGQRQRVAMGRAIVREPGVFLFDEPLSNLDAKLRVDMRIEIRRLHRRLKATSIFVTHDQVEAMTLADRLIVMNGGRIAQIGTPAEVYARPASTFVASFMGAPAMNLFEAATLNERCVKLKNCEDWVTEAGFRLPPAGHGVTVGIRPEDVAISLNGKGLAARIELIEELGGSRVAYCSRGALACAAMLPRDIDFSEDQTVFLNFPASAIHLFDQEGARFQEDKSNNDGNSAQADKSFYTGVKDALAVMTGTE